MGDFREMMEETSIKMMKRFHQPYINRFSHNHQKDAWIRYIQQQAVVDVRLDLTMKQSATFYVPAKKDTPATYDKVYLTEALASINLHQFLELLNYAVYKHAYKRYGKSLSVVSVSQGAQQTSKKVIQRDLRENLSKSNDDKRIHLHLLIEQPKHLIFDDYKALIRRLWRKTKFGYGEDKIEPIQNLFASSSYNLRYGTDSIDLDNTYL